LGGELGLFVYFSKNGKLSEGILSLDQDIPCPLDAFSLFCD
jgi:hypothetical protein